MIGNGITMMSRSVNMFVWNWVLVCWNRSWGGSNVPIPSQWARQPATYQLEGLLQCWSAYRFLWNVNNDFISSERNSLQHTGEHRVTPASRGGLDDIPRRKWACMPPRLPQQNQLLSEQRAVLSFWKWVECSKSTNVPNQPCSVRVRCIPSTMQVFIHHMYDM